MKAGVEPCLQAGLGIAEVDSGHPDLGESQLVSPGADLHDQCVAIQLVTVDHQTILGTRPESRTLRWRSEAECAATAAQLASKPAIRNAFIALDGPLGAGKTTFVRYLLRALGVRGHIKSPTYAVMEPYELPGLAIAHLDFYRFDDASEFIDAGLRDVFERPGLKLAEWPGRAGTALPRPDLCIELEPTQGNERRVKLTALSPTGLELLP